MIPTFFLLGNGPMSHTISSCGCSAQEGIDFCASEQVLCLPKKNNLVDLICRHYMASFLPVYWIGQPDSKKNIHFIICLGPFHDSVVTDDAFIQSIYHYIFIDIWSLTYDFLFAM